MQTKTIRLEKKFTPEDCKKCFYIDFEVPENVEELRIRHTWTPKEEGNLDFGLVGADGRQIGASGNVRQDVIISEKYATPGYDRCTPVAGKWKIIVGIDRVGNGVCAAYEILFRFKEKRWLKGDTHSHTNNSDGKYSPEELIEKANKKGLDYLIITDHNNSVAAYHDYNNRDMLVLKGTELTSFLGHINFWGVKQAFTKPYCVNSFEDFLPLYAQAKQNGAVISLNHPECKNCGWHLPREGFTYDCVEIWNGPQRIDNMTAIAWWHGELLKGKHLAAVGGSDYHKDYLVTDLLARPTTYVCAESCTAADILKALKQGNAFVTESVNGPKLFLTCGQAIQGDTVEFAPKTTVHIKAEGLKRKDRIVVYGNDTILYAYTAKAGEKAHEADISVQEKGFVRAEILTQYGAIRKLAYKTVMHFRLPADCKLPIPPFARCVSNPIYFV